MSLDDDEFSYGADPYDSGMSSPDGALDDGRTQVVQNQPHDEEVSLSDSESFSGDPHPSSNRQYGSGNAGISSAKAKDDIISDSRHSPTTSTGVTQQSPATIAAAAAAVVSHSGDEQQHDEAGAYNAMDYKHLNVSDDVRELFKYIGRYKPQSIELETKVKPFIPDYIPAVGGIDEFIKVPRPDGKADYLGLKVLDEPAAKQSDPTVLNLQLRQLSKEAAGGRAEVVGRVEHTDENRHKKISQWISSIQDIQKAKPPAVVRHDTAMPELESLMQEWPPEMEALLRPLHLPTGDLDLPLPTYVKMVCSMLDIPVHQDPIPSLHQLFSLLLEFRTNPFFRHHLDTGAMQLPISSGSPALSAPGTATFAL